MSDDVNTGVVSDHSQEPVPVDKSVDRPGWKPKPERRFSKESKAAKRRAQDAARAAVDAGERLKRGVAPTAEMLAQADPEALAAHLRAPLGVERFNRVDGDRQPINTIGRPLEYTEEEANDLLAWIQEGKSLNSWLQLNLRKASTVYRWMSRVPSFREKYALALEDRADTLVDQMLDLADALTEGGRSPTMEQVKAVDLQISTRKWCAERMRPSKWALLADRQPAQSITFNISTGRRTTDAAPLTIEQGTAGDPMPLLPQVTAQVEPASD